MVWTHLNPPHHIQMTLTILLNNIADIVWFTGLLKLAPCHQILDFPDGSNCIFMRVCQSETVQVYAISQNQPTKLTE